MSTPSIVEEPVDRGREDLKEPPAVDVRTPNSLELEHPTLRMRVRNELWRPGYLVLAILILVLLALQVWILF